MSSNFVYKENDDRFYIDDSTIKHAGKGLFAKKKIIKGERLMISGALVERGTCTDTCTTYANCYKFGASIENDECGKYVIVPLGFAALVNHAEVVEKQNVEIKYFGNYEIAYVFMQDVEANQEILGNYGESWNSMIQWSHKQLENIKVEKKTWEKFLDLNLYDLGELR